MAVGWNFDRIIFMTAGIEIKKNIYGGRLELIE
jgi:hypothetical protein